MTLVVDNRTFNVITSALMTSWGETKERVRQMLSQGFTPRQIALDLGISTQRVYVLMRELRKEAEEASA